jgi:hypothetical protein
MCCYPAVLKPLISIDACHLLFILIKINDGAFFHITRDDFLDKNTNNESNAISTLVLLFNFCAQPDVINPAQTRQVLATSIKKNFYLPRRINFNSGLDEFQIPVPRQVLRLSSTLGDDEIDCIYIAYVNKVTFHA